MTKITKDHFQGQDWISLPVEYDEPYYEPTPPIKLSLWGKLVKRIKDWIASLRR